MDTKAVQNIVREQFKNLYYVKLANLKKKMMNF